MRAAVEVSYEDLVTYLVTPFHVDLIDLIVGLDYSTSLNYYNLLVDTFHEVDCRCYVI